MPKRKAYPENALGPFYVEDDLCIQCGNPEAVAPRVVGSNEHHCYFKKQPQSAAELEEAIKAVNHCCCGAYRYAGSDPEIIARLDSWACDINDRD
jgi:hypothetical protein